MSFYGNVINNNTMQFTFDRIYPNRQAMEDCTVDDDIFVGRFVLIDYNEGDIFKKYYKQLYRNGESFGFQNKENAFTEATVIEDENYYIELESGTTIINPAYSAEDNKQKLLINEPFYVYENNKYYFYRCLGKGNFSLIYSSQENDDVYSINFKIDSLKYELDDRGWDSTVWQKIVYEGKEKYTMIAELNSLVPEIELYVDAPTTLPEAPYFDVNSTDRIYNLHMQPSWGIRIAEVKDNDISDVKIEGEFTKWDEDKKEIITINEYQGDIYFNKAGFSADKGYKSNKIDSISLLPTGISGYNYDNQQGNKPEEDIKELSICLPSIGNAISNLWDIVYGGNNNSDNTSTYDRNTNIDWNNINGLRLVSLSNDGYTYDTEAVNTLAGCINSVHDLMGMIILEDNEGNTSLADAKTDRIYYGNFNNSSKKGYFIKTRKNTYIPLEHEDLRGYVNSKKYINLTQYTKAKYYTKINDNFYEELDENPTANTNYYDIKATPIVLKDWISEVAPDNPGDEEITYNHYWMDDELNYIKDIALEADPEKTYYTLTPIQQTYTSNNIDINKEIYLREIYKPVPRTEIVTEDKTYYNGYLYFEILGYETDEDGNPTDIPIYGDKVYELMPQIYDAEGNPVLDADGKPTFEEADLLNKEAIYFKTDYQIVSGTDNGELVHPLCNMSGDPFNASNMPEEIDKVIFIDFDEKDAEGNSINYYFADSFEIENGNENSNTTGYRRLEKIDDYDPTVIYYTIVANQETGEFEKEAPEGEDVETTLIHYYTPEQYYYKQGNNNYIFGKEPKMVPGVEYFTLSGHDTPLDITFYEPAKYYYEKKVTTIVDDKEVVETIQILDNDMTMKTSETVLGDNEQIVTKDNLIYFLKQQAYVINDSSGILSAGSIWNSTVDPDKIPKTLTFGKLYQGEDIVGENGNPISNDEKAERMYEWKELDGFARTLNTIHGLILKLNQYFKFDDSLTRDRTTIQGCLNCINDIINDFATLNPGEIAVIDEYGRIKSATLDDSDETGWISVAVNPNVEETKITICHNNAKEATTILGQTQNQDLTFGGTFQALSFGVDDKGHINSSQATNYTMTMPRLQVATDNTSGEVVTDFKVDNSSQALVISRKNVGDFILTGYSDANSTTDTGDSDANSTVDIGDNNTVNQAFGKLQTKLNKEIKDRADAINALNMTKSEDTTQFISSIEQKNGVVTVSRAHAGTLVLGNEYATATETTATAITQTDSINSAVGKLEYKLNILNAGSTQPGSVAYQIAQIVEDDQNGSIDKLKEIATWIVNDETGAAKMNADIGSLTEKITSLNGLIDDNKVKSWNTQANWAETSEDSPAFIKSKPDLTNLVKTTSKFDYKYNESTTSMTIQAMFDYIATLEARIDDLENSSANDDQSELETPPTK